MSVRRIGGLACLALAAVTGLNGLRSLWDVPDIADSSGQGISYAIGRLVVPALLLAVGLWLMQGRKHESHRAPREWRRSASPPGQSPTPGEMASPKRGLTVPGVRMCPACGSAIRRDSTVCPFCDADLARPNAR